MMNEPCAVDKRKVVSSKVVEARRQILKVESQEIKLPAIRLHTQLVIMRAVMDLC